MRKISRFNTLAERVTLFGGSAAIVILGFILAYQFVEPAPPRSIRIATGGAEYAYYNYALQYQTLLKKEGINLQVVETAGSVENLALLKAGKVDIAFMQSGIGSEDTTLPSTNETVPLNSLGSLYFEPLWLFTHKNLKLEALSDLKGKRIIVGSEGSGTRPVALTLLNDNGITANNAELLNLTGSAALEALENNQADAFFMVTSPSSKSVQQLLFSEEYTLFNFNRSMGYQRLHSFLSSVQLPAGVVNMEHNIPARDITLLAPTATLVVPEDFHSALAALFLQIATDIHGKSTVFSNAGAFPSKNFTDFPLHEDAERFFKSGPPLLQRYLPFWAANLVDRLFVMILPILTLMIPLAKLLPPTYRWRIRSRIYRWYDELRDLDFKAETAEGVEQTDALLNDLNRIEKEVMQVDIPKSYAENQYNLRLHIRLIREVLERKRHGL